MDTWDNAHVVDVTTFTPSTTIGGRLTHTFIGPWVGTFQEDGSVTWKRFNHRSHLRLGPGLTYETARPYAWRFHRGKRG